MNSVLNSLLHDHDSRLIMLALVVCAFGAATTMNISGRVAGRQRGRLWLALLAVCAGATVWATHFIAMLAYQAEIPATYDIGLTALSLLAGIVVMGFGFDVALHEAPPAWVRAVGGGIVGIGVALLHYLGMAAVRMPAMLSYAPGLAITSVVLAITFGSIALMVACDPARAWGRAGGALLMIAMVVSLHFTAMGAVHLDHGGMRAGMEGGVTRSVLATAVAVASLAVLLIGMTGAIVDQRVSARLAADADRFRALSNGAFEGVVVHRAGRIMDANAAARRMLLLDGRSSGAITGLFIQGLSGQWSEAQDDAEAIEVVLCRPDGFEFPAEVSRRRMVLFDGKDGEVLAFRDLTSRKESEARFATRQGGVIPLRSAAQG